VKDSDGQEPAYVHFDDPRSAAKLLTKDEARRIAANVAKLRARASWPPLSLPYRRAQFA